jgi:hypothetical protein
MILSHPDMGDRYFTFQLASFTSDNFAYVGKRATGSKAGHFALVGPNWRGTQPLGVTAVAPPTTPTIFVLGRTLVDGEADLPAVHALQDQYRLTPLSLWGQPDAQMPEDRNANTTLEGQDAIRSVSTTAIAGFCSRAAKPSCGVLAVSQSRTC